MSQNSSDEISSNSSGNYSFVSASSHAPDDYHLASLPNEPEGNSGCCTVSKYYNAFLKCVGATNLNLVWFIVVLSFGAVLALSVALEKPYDINPSYIHYFFIVSMSIGSVWMWGAFTCRAPPCGCCIVGRNAESEIPCYMIIALAFFCIGSCFISGVDFLSFMYTLQCQKVKESEKSELVIEGVYNLAKLAFLIFQLHFFCRFSQNTFYRRCCTSFFILHIIAVNLTSWLYFIVKESVERGNSTERYKNCTELNDIDGFIQAADTYLYPFNIEYTVMSSVLFLLLWFELKKKPKTQQNHHRQDSNRQNHRTLSSTLKRCCSKAKDWWSGMCNCCRQPFVLNAENNTKTMFFWKSAVFGYTVGILILTAYLVLIVLMAEEYPHSATAYYAVRITLFLLLASASGFGLACLPKGGSHNKLHTRVDSILIMIGVSGCYVLSFFEILSGISDGKQCSNTTHATNIVNPANHSMLHADDNDQIHVKDICPVLALYLADKIICLVQFSLQAIFIVKALRRGQEKVSLTSVSSLSVVRNVSAILSLGNFGIWALDTFELKDIPIVNNVENVAYSPQIWHILIHIVYPLCIFFRLHSAFCFFEVVINRFGVSVQRRFQGFRHIRRSSRPCIQDGPAQRYRANSF